MSRAKTFIVTGSTGGPTYSPAYPIDTWNNPCNIGIGIIVSGNNSVVDLQETFSDPWNTNLNVVSAGVWINNSVLTSATKAGAPNGAYDTNYAFPPRAIRIRVRALASAGVDENTVFTIQQAGKE